ncbi:MAG: mandelate racemase/muconate lactonizing enzyme family protein [Nitrososphaerota archaeon]|jgi:L-alanine-DL-glutamate epimerase-like enolase superfamily enzyme|nr:mandelate racemase/muconate lactonizing enzyme family protein [Nitrososphaerota archaeon]
MKITRVQTTRHVTPFFESFKVSYGLQEYSEHVILKLSTDDRTEGLGDATPLWFFTGETVESVEHVIEMLKPQILGMDPFDGERTLGVMNTLSKNPSAKSSVEMAIYDLRARSLGIPVWKLLGGKIRSEIRASGGIGVKPKDQTVKAATRLLENGLTAFKLKVIGDPEGEAERIRAVRDAVGKSVTLRIDANGAYSSRRAVDLAKRVSACDLEYFEQPVRGDDIQGLREVRDSIDFQVMADESVFTSRDAMRIIEERAADIVGVKFAKCGGISASRGIIEVCRSAGVPCIFISAFETWIGISANVHVIASSDNIIDANDLALWTIQHDDPASPLEHTGGRIKVPDGPGLGVRMTGAQNDDQ